MNNKDLRMKYKRCCHCKYFKEYNTSDGGSCTLKNKDFVVFKPSKIRAHLCKAYELKK